MAMNFKHLGPSLADHLISSHLIAFIKLRERERQYGNELLV
jgi:hypothetical protein